MLQTKTKNLLLISSIIAVICFGLLTISPVLADSSLDLGVDEVGEASGLGTQDIRVTIGKIIKVFLGILGAIALVIFLYAGYLYMTAGGRDDQVATAKKWMINATIGLIIILAAYAIVAFIINSLTEATDYSASYQCADGIDNDGDGQIDYPADSGCSSDSDYSEYASGGLNITGGSLFRVKSITPQGTVPILNVNPKIIFNKAIDPSSINPENIRLESTATITNTTTLKPVEVGEPNGNGAEILEQIEEDDNVWNSNWVVCSASYLGGTPLKVKYDLSSIGYSNITAARLNFENKTSGASPIMKVSCGAAEDPDEVLVVTDYNASAGQHSLDLPTDCLIKGNDLFIQWARIGPNCHSFDYMQLEVDHLGGEEVAGQFTMSSNAKKVTFIPDGECSESDPEAYALKANVTYKVKLTPGGIQSAGGDDINCGPQSQCLGSFTTGSVCDVTPPEVIFVDPYQNKNVCQFSIDDPDPMYPVSLEVIDDAGVGSVTAQVDGDDLGTEAPTTGEAETNFVALFYWAINNYDLGAHTLAARAFDIDGNEDSSAISVIVRPDYCCAADGTYVCGQVGCGACEDGACTTDADCAEAQCVNGKCVAYPIITNFTPKEGAAGNMVSIVGNGFGSYDSSLSQVFFSDGTEAGKYALPAALGCDPSDSWNNKEVIVKVPAGVGNGPIKIQTNRYDAADPTNRKGWDDTENSYGYEGVYTHNPYIKYPGLCSMTPNTGPGDTRTNLGGEGFGSPDGNDFIDFGGVQTIYAVWSDNSITNVRAPQLTKGPYNVMVSKGEECKAVVPDCEAEDSSCLVDCVETEEDCQCREINSNPKRFDITVSASLPTITSIDPGSAPAKQLITISGSNFGDNIGQVYFAETEFNDEGIRVVKRDAEGNELPSFIGVPACGSSGWSDSQIVIQVPEEKEVDDTKTDIYASNYFVRVVTAQSLVSNDESFIVIDGQPGPGLCLLNPDNGPIGTSFDLAGKSLGASSQYDIHFVKAVSETAIVSTVGDWTDLLISEALVPAEALSGRVFLATKEENLCEYTTAGTGNTCDPLFDENCTCEATESCQCLTQSNGVQFDVGACSADSCSESEFCCNDGVCRSGDGPKEDVCGEVIVSFDSEFAWLFSTGFVPKVPEVLERSCFVSDGPSYPQSPSPYKHDLDACPNGLISASFNMLIDSQTLNNNVEIKRCLETQDLQECKNAEGQFCTEGEADCECYYIACNLEDCPAGECVSSVLTTLADVDVTGNSDETPPEAGVALSITCQTSTGSLCSPDDDDCTCTESGELTSFSLFSSYGQLGIVADDEIDDVVRPFSDNYKLFPDTWYQVEIKAGQTGIAALPALGGEKMIEDYVWKFKTQSSDCSATKLLMKPSRGRLRTVNALQDHMISGLFECQELSLIDEDWSWSVTKHADKAQWLGFGCADDTLMYPFYDSAGNSNTSDTCAETQMRPDIGVYGVSSTATNCYFQGTTDLCDPYDQANNGCQCDLAAGVETSLDDPAEIKAFAEDTVNNITYDKRADLEINFGDPRVTSYFPNCNEACINAMLGANFNLQMKSETLINPANVNVYACFSKDCVVMDELSGSIGYGLAYQLVFPTASSPMISQLKITPLLNLTPNQYYRVTISGDVESASSVKLTGLNYSDDNFTGDGVNAFSWIFKTKNDANECVIDTVGVQPADYETDIPGEKIQYAALPRSAPDVCSPDGQILNPFNYGWAWSSTDTYVATVTENTYSQDKPPFCSDNCLVKGSSSYGAVCGNGLLEQGEECEFNASDQIIDDSGINSNIGCSETKCLLTPFSNCTQTQLDADATSVLCCGDGEVEGDEECDQGCEYKDSKGAACDPADADCTCESKGSVCSAGCLNLGTSSGFTCGNGETEPGEDADEGDNKGGDGLSSKCINEGSKYVEGQISATSVCGNGVIDQGEECEPSAANPYCTNKCIWLGFPSCNDTGAGEACCGNTVLEDFDGDGNPDEECEANYCTTSSGAYCYQTNMTAYWNMERDDNDELIASVIGNQANLTPEVHGSKVWSGSQFGEAFQFTGENYVNIPNSQELNLGNEYSFSVWIHVADNVPFQSILHQGHNSFRLFQSGSGAPLFEDKLYFRAMNESGADHYALSSEITPVDTWLFVVGTYDGETIKLYVNGDEKASYTETNQGSIAAPNYSADPLGIGASPSGNNKFTGLMDELRLYDRVLIPSEITYIYNNGTCYEDSVEQVCSYGEPGCNCQMPAWCSKKCTNLGSSVNYNSICGDGEVGNGVDNSLGEDSICEIDASGDPYGNIDISPYQVATINSTKDPNGIYVISKSVDTTPISLSTSITALTQETIQGNLENRSGTGELTFATDNPYCTSFSEVTMVTEPMAGATDVCLNPVIEVEFNQPVVIDETTRGYFYYDNFGEACPEGTDLPGGIVYDYNSMKWWQKAWHQISTFVRNLLFKVGLAATPEGPNYCLEPEPKIEGRVEADKALFQIHPAGVLQKNKNYFFKVINLKNKCGDVLTILPTNTLDFTTGEEICRLDNVAIIPVDEFVLKTYQNLPYEAIPQHGTQHIGEIPGVYEWFFDWSSTNTAIGFPVESEANDRHSDVRTFAENGQAVIRAKATISVDNLALNCANVNSGAVCVPNPADPDCQCTPDPKEEVTVGASYTGYGQLTVFICDNPWFSDIYDNSALPPAYKWDLTDPDNVNKKFDIKYAISNDGTLAPSYLVEKEFNAGLFYCRDFGAAGNFADDLPKIGLTAGAFTELDPVPRYGYYFDRHQDHVLVVTATDLDFMNDKTNSWTISTWVYNNDIPTDRYARVFYKNLDSAVSYEGTKDHVQLAFRRWGVGCDDLAGNACAWDYTSAGANPNSCDDSTCAFSRSLTYQIRNGSVNINKGIDNVNDLLQDGFNQITLSYNGAAEQAFLYVNGKDVDNLRDEQTSLYTWPRIDTEIDINGNRYDFMFIGGLGETDIPSVSLGGYMDDFRVYDQAKTPADILADPADHLLIGYDFDTQEKFSIPIEGSSSSSTGKNACTPDFAESQCVSSGVFKVHNLSQLALEEGLYGEDTSGWSELSADIFNQCSDGKDNDYNGLTDMADPKCKDDSDPWEEPAMMAQYFFVRKADTAFPDTNDNAADAISMRIFENPEHLPPDIWYQRYAPYSTSNLPIIESDCMTDDFGSYCYQAVQDGTSVYISAANINSTNVYNNIYLLSYSGNANQATVNIYNQLVQFMKFNMNILSDSMVNKYQLIRDDIRTTNFVVLREYIKLYKQTHQGKVPQLDGGTLQRHMTNSIWESWNKDFQNTLKSTVPGTSILKSRPFPVDPQNQLAFNPPSFKCSDPQGNTCLPDMDNCTCYQAAIKNEECGANDNGNVLYCYDDEQCVLPGFACIDCSDNFDSKYCYKGSNQSFSAKPDASGTSIPIYDLYSSKYYGYEANAADETEYKLTVKKETTLDYKVVPEYEEIAGGWESLKIEEEEALAAPTYASPTDLPQCMNGIDDDLNGLTDYPADPGCTDADGGATDALEYFEYDCRDGDDNDVDTKTDYCKADGSNADTCDPSCSDEFDNDEYNPPQCSDGVDNDEDGNCDLGDCVDADGNPLSADIGCVDAADNDESYRGLPNGKILFAFFADTSGSMSFVDRDPAMIHQDLIRGIIDGVGNINGIDDVLGEKAYYTLGTSHNGDVARKKYFPAGQKDHFLQWLDCSEGWLECPYGSAECLEKFNCGGAGLCEKSYCTENDQCSSGYCDPSGYNPNAVGTIKPGCGKKGPSGEEAPICSSPYIYNGSAYMPTRIQLTMQDSVAEVLPGHFEGMVYIVFTDADDLPSGCVDVDGIACTYGKENCLCEDTDEYIALNQTLDLANDNLIPIHFIYIRNVALPENSAKYQFYYNYYSGVNAKHRGVWLQGSIDFLENNLDDIVSAIAVPPAEVVEDTSEAGF